MSQPGFFDLLESVIDWKIFLPLLNRAFEHERKSAAGRKPNPHLMMLKNEIS